ncbi:hypothetical protein [Pseudomonas sp. ML96]|uniref:hypothetical protein n=1 Tax=Pseudomonas sp. ML96 TaxID=1523503 RepID=UPI000A56BF21|nr:hypothetical protein [Pseudomonas sp. ML96]
MADTVVYSRGTGGITLTEDQQGQLSALLDMQEGLYEQKNEELGLGKPLYEMLLGFISDTEEILIYDNFGLVIGAQERQVPKEGVDPAVWRWIQGAPDVNSGQGFFADYIREYTKAQYMLRGGNPDLAADLNQTSSNLIAFALIKDILKYEGELPGHEGLGAIDAGRAASTVFQMGPHGSGDYAPWAGSLLFPYLGFDRFTEDFLFRSTPLNAVIDGVLTEVKHIAGSYDLVAAIQASRIASINAGFDNIYDGIQSLLFELEVLEPDQQDLINSADAFFWRHYGLIESDGFDPGDNLPFDKELSQFTEEYIVGTYGNDFGLTTTSGDDILNAGLGDDLVMASADSDLIDGAEGVDTIVYAGLNFQAVLEFNTDLAAGAYYDFRVEVDKGVGRDYLYGVEYLYLGRGDDTLILGSVDFSKIKDFLGIDFGENGDKGDLLDASLADAALIMEGLGGGAFSVNGQFYVKGLEKVVGTRFSDVIETGAGNDTLDGGKGSDTISGGGGFDCYNFRSGDGQDLVIDVGGQGEIWIDGTHYDTARKLAAGSDVWLSVDGLVIFKLIAGDLLILYGDGDGITIQGFQNGMLGLTLEEPGAHNVLVPSSSSYIYGDNGGDSIDDTSQDDVILSYAGDDYINWTSGSGVGGSDYIDTGAGNDYAAGGAGSDTLIGGEGIDRLFGRSGDDLLIANLIGDEGAGTNPSIGISGDWLDGGYGKDTLTGSGGDDGLFGGGDADLVIGGAGNDVIFGDTFTGNTPNIPILAYVNIRIGDENYTTIESIASSWVDRQAYGNDTLLAGSGDDWVYGAGGNDLIDGGVGSDYLIGGGGNDVVIGGEDNDTLIGDGYDDNADDTESLGLPGRYHGRDILFGGAGDDRVIGNGGDDQLYGEAGKDILLGDDRITPGEFHGRDLLNGGGQDDTLIGMGGADTLLGGDGNDVLDGDLIGLELEWHGNDSLDGGVGNDTLYGQGGADTLLGGVGDDQLIGDNPDIAAAFDDYLDGGSGNDTLWGGVGNDTLLGGSDADLLSDIDGNNYFEGGTGNDTLGGGLGDDHYLFKGGDGVDTVSDLGGTNKVTLGAGYDLATMAVTVYNLVDGVNALKIANTTGDEVVFMNYQNWLSTNFEVSGKTKSLSDLLASIHTSISVVGDSSNELLLGGSGGDSIRGGGGSDMLQGGQGNDTYLISLGDGVDFIKDEDGFNSVLFGEGISAESLTFGKFYNFEGRSYLTVNYEGGQIFVENGMSGAISDFYFSDGSRLALREALTQTGGLTLFASDSGGELLGSDSNDILSGGLGRDLITAFAGNDHLYGNGGDDCLLGGSGDDRVVGGSGHDHLQGDAGSDTLIGGAGEDTLWGGDGGDEISGGDGSDLLDGADGDDVLSGGAGNDTLVGGAGIDTYVFSTGSGFDLIRDVEGEYSVLQLTSAIQRSDLKSRREGNDLLISYKDGSQGLSIENYYDNPDGWKVVDASGSEQSMDSFVNELAGNTVVDINFWESLFKQKIQNSFSLDQEGMGAELGSDGYYHHYSEGRGWERNDAVRVVFEEFSVDEAYGFEHDGVHYSWVSRDSSSYWESSEVSRPIYSAAGGGVSSNGSSGYTFVSANELQLFFANQGAGFKVPGVYAPVYSSSDPDNFIGAIFGLGQGQASGSGLQSSIVTYTKSSSWTDEIYRVITGDDVGRTFYATEGNIIRGGAGDDFMMGFASLQGFDSKRAADDGVFLSGGDGQDTLLGTYSDDYLVGGVGDDLLMGGGGADTYVFFSDGGVDIVNDFPLPSYTDFIKEADGIYLETSELAKVDKIVLPPEVSLENIEVKWGRALAEVNSGKAEWFLPSENQERLSGDHRSRSEFDIYRSMRMCLTLDISLDGGQVIRVVIPQPDSPQGSGIELYQFSDGTVLSHKQLLDHFGLGVAPDISAEGQVLKADDIYQNYEWLPLQGMQGNDTLYSGAGDDYLLGGGGDDILCGSQGWDILAGGGGADHYYFLAENFSDSLSRTFIYDSDGKGCIYIDGQAVDKSGLVSVGENYWESRTGGYSAVLGQDGFVININGMSIVVPDFEMGDFGIDLVGVNPSRLLSSESLISGKPWSFQLPLDVDENNQAPVFSASLGNGQSLPGWLSLDSQTGIVSGTLESVGWFDHVIFTASYPGGGEVSYELLLYSAYNNIEGGDGSDLINGTAFDDYISTGAGNNYVNAGDGADVVEDWDGDDTIVGGQGSDSLYGGAGSDVYIYGRGDGRDVIYNNGGDSSSVDTLQFGQSISLEDIWFSRSGNNLRVDILGGEGSIEIGDWYAGEQLRLDSFKVSSGSQILEGQIQGLVDAMAAFGSPVAGEVSLTQAQRDQLNVVIAASWQ